MKLLNFGKLRDVTTIATATLATLSLATMNPAFAVLIGFCGTFTNGGTVDGVIDVGNDGSFNASKYAKITTYEVGQTNKREYQGIDFVSLDLNAQTTNGLGGPLFDAFKYTFKYDSLSFPANSFEAYIPKAYFPISGILPELRVQQVEFRDGIFRKDPDKTFEVPEPSSFLGTAITLGLGLMVKRNLSKFKQDRDAA